MHLTIQTQLLDYVNNQHLLVTLLIYTLYEQEGDKVQTLYTQYNIHNSVIDHMEEPFNSANSWWPADVLIVNIP